MLLTFMFYVNLTKYSTL